LLRADPAATELRVGTPDSGTDVIPMTNDDMQKSDSLLIAFLILARSNGRLFRHNKLWFFRLDGHEVLSQPMISVRINFFSPRHPHMH